jgi:hypothetical protein
MSVGFNFHLKSCRCVFFRPRHFQVSWSWPQTYTTNISILLWSTNMEKNIPFLNTLLFQFRMICNCIFKFILQQQKDNKNNYGFRTDFRLMYFVCIHFGTTYNCGFRSFLGHTILVCVSSNEHFISTWGAPKLLGLN